MYVGGTELFDRPGEHREETALAALDLNTGKRIDWSPVVNGFEAKWSTGFRNQHGLEIPPSLRPRPEEKSLNYFGSRRGDFLKISLSVLVNMPP
jgi:hypothetical protein